MVTPIRPPRPWPHSAGNFTITHVQTVFRKTGAETQTFLTSQGVADGLAALNEWKSKYDAKTVPSLAQISEKNLVLAGQLPTTKIQVCN